MALPELIPARYTEEDAGYMSVRPVVAQTFRLAELLDMIVGVAGKDAARVQQILRTGSVVYHGYRYWWDPLAPESGEIERLLVPFPDDDPARPFTPENATGALFEMGGGAQRTVAEITRRDALQKKLFGVRSPWDVLLAWAKTQSPRYEKYDHARKADLYRISIPYNEAQELLAAMLQAAPRKLRHQWRTLRPPAAITFVCSRDG